MAKKEINLNDVIFDSAMLYYTDFDTSNLETAIASLKGHELGLSDGGVTFSSEPEIRDIPFAGALERKIKGYQRILKTTGKIEGQILPINADLLTMSLYKKDTVTSVTYDKYIPTTGLIADSYYKDLVLVGTTADETDIIIVIRNTYNSAFNLDTKDKEEGKIKVAFEGCYEKGSDIPPIEIYIPKGE